MDVKPSGFFVHLKGIFERLKENELGMRLLLAFICFLALTLFIHFKEIQVESLELNTTANRYVVAQIDFEFPDEDKTFFLKQEALSDIGNIYKIDEKVLQGANFDFEHFLIHDSSWRDQLSDVSLSQIYQTVENLQNLLQESKFTDALTKTKLNKYGINIDNYYVITSKLAGKKLPKEYWAYFKKYAGYKLDVENPKLISFIINFFEKRNWPLIDDVDTERNVRQYIEDSVPLKYTAVKAGTKIIAQGEKVRAKHIAILQAMKKTLDEKRSLWDPVKILGNMLMSLIFILILALYLKIDQKKVFKSLQKLSLFACIFIMTLAFAKVTEYILLQNSNNLIDAVHYPIIVPFAAILIFILFNSRMAIFVTSLITIILAITLAVDHAKFLIINFVSSILIIVTTKSLRRRKEVFEVCGKSLLGAVPVIIAFNLITRHLWVSSFISDIAISVLFVVIIAILVVGLLPILESLFDVMTDITLMEYMDPNNELLKRLTLEMPGTYQHSLVLGNLAEVAASAIGANALLCKVATLYHDIGKLNNSHFFTENQQVGVNIHQLLTPLESAQVIISHVKDGVMLAKKYRLPQSFIDIIQQHHGTMLVYYFYRKELELQGGDESKVDQNLFRYPGPKPRTKEAAITMIADGAEAASRSISEPTEELFVEMIDKVIKDRAEDHQFDECNLTFQDLEIIKKTLAHTLMMTRHVRIKYPEKKESDNS